MRLLKLRTSLILIMLGLTIGIAFIFLGTPWGFWKYENNFRMYLENKYHKDFRVENMSYDMFHGGLFSAQAYFIDQPDIKFYVGQNYKTKQIEDGYYSAIWQHQVRNDLAPMVEKIFPKSTYSINASPNCDRFVFEELNVPNYIDCTVVSLSVSLSEFEVTDDNQLSEAEKIRLLLITLIEKGVNLDSFSIAYQNKTMYLNATDINKVTNGDELKQYLKSYK